MYVRNQNVGRRVRPPDNYSGNAFDKNGYRTHHDLPLPPELMPSSESRPPEALGRGMELPPLDIEGEIYENDFGASDRAPLPQQSCECEESKENRDERGGLRGILSSILPPRSDGDRGEFSFEDMLIIGLIFLISQSEDESEILLALMLLLFYK